MGRATEPLTGGVVTNKDPALLAPGELSAARNTYYIPGSQALTRAKGRTLFGAVATATAGNPASVVGLRDMKFDNGNHYLIAHASTSYLTAAVGATGTFASLVASIGAGTQLESAHFRNRFFLFNGTSANEGELGSNRVAFLSATATGTSLSVRQHGMLPVSEQPFITTATGSFALTTATGFYEYWTTEVAQVTQDGAMIKLESGFTGDPKTMFVDASSTVPIIQRHNIKNQGFSTSWRVYRSPKKDSDRPEDKKFPIGFMIAENATSVTSVADTTTVTATGFFFPVSFNSGVTYFKDWTNAGNATGAGADDAAYASGVVPSAISFSTIFRQQQGYYGFPFTGISGQIRGIEVVAEAYVASGSAPMGLTVTIGPNRRADGGYSGSSQITHNHVWYSRFGDTVASKTVLVTATAAGSPQVLTLGGSADRWYQPSQAGLSDLDFNSNFMVVLEVAEPGKSMGVDYVKVKVHYAATIDSVIQFPTVVYTFGDIVAQVSKNGPPPSSSTGDLYEDSLVVNDVDQPANIKYSYPGDPEAFPDTYLIDFETEDNDRVRLIKTVNDRLVVALDRSVWRVNYLPSERDASFDTAKCKQAISRTYGCVNPMCACIFSPTGGTELLAMVSHNGIWSTNGHSFDFISDMHDWRQIMSLSSTSTPIALINDPELKLLRFYFRNDSYSNETYLCLPLSYAPEHMEGGRLKSGGFIHMRNYDSGAGGTYASLESAWAVPRTNGDTSIYLGYGGTATAAGAGRAFIESGSTIPANDPAYQYTTRRMYLAGFANEWRLGDLYAYSRQTGTQSFTYTPLTIKTGDSAGEVTQTAKSISVSASERLTKVPFSIGAEGMRLSFSVTAGHDDLAKEFLVLDGEDFGEEDSGK